MPSPLCLLTQGLRQRTAVREVAELREAPKCKEQDGAGGDGPRPGLEPRRESFEGDGEEEDGEVEGWKVMVQEELTLHKVEGEVVQSPGHEEEAEVRVVRRNQS